MPTLLLNSDNHSQYHWLLPGGGDSRQSHTSVRIAGLYRAGLLRAWPQYQFVHLYQRDWWGEMAGLVFHGDVHGVGLSTFHIGPDQYDLDAIMVVDAALRDTASRNCLCQDAKKLAKFTLLLLRGQG